MTSLVHAKFRPLTVVLPTERIMKEAINMVLVHIYDREYPETAHFRLGFEGRNEFLKRLKQELQTTGIRKWFLKFNRRNSVQNIERHKLIQILKEDIDDPQFFYNIQKVLLPGPDDKFSNSVPQSVVLSTTLLNICRNKLDLELIRQDEIPISQRIRSVLRTGPPSPADDQENSGEEAKFNIDNIVRRRKSTQRKSAFQSLVSSCNPTSTHEFRGDQKRAEFSINTI